MTRGAPDWLAQRQGMVADTLVGRGIDDPRVLEAMREVPRHLFVPPAQRGQSYEDRPLPIGEGQTISQPFVVALMAQALALGPDDRVLEVGTGSGYAAAVLGRLAGEVYSVERRVALARASAQTLEELGMRNVHVSQGDGTQGLPEHAPYDAIAVAAGGPVIPEALLAQLAEGGRLLMPVGVANEQFLVLVTRLPQGQYRHDSLGPVRFVPLIEERHS